MAPVISDLEVVTVEALGGRSVRLTFTNDDKKVVDLMPFFEGCAAFNRVRLSDRVFRKVHPFLGGIGWPIVGEPGIDAAVLHGDMPVGAPMSPEEGATIARMHREGKRSQPSIWHSLSREEIKNRYWYSWLYPRIIHILDWWAAVRHEGRARW